MYLMEDCLKFLDLIDHSFGICFKTITIGLKYKKKKNEEGEMKITKERKRKEQKGK